MKETTKEIGKAIFNVAFYLGLGLVAGWVFAENHVLGAIILFAVLAGNWWLRH